jgi:hypothetical protein
VARAILRDFEVDEAELLPRMKRWFLPQYMQLVAKLLPKNGTEGVGDDGSALAGVADMDAAARVAALRAALAAAEAELGSEDR